MDWILNIVSNGRLLLLAIAVLAMIYVGVKLLLKSDDKQQDYSKGAQIAFNNILGLILIGIAITGGVVLISQEVATTVTNGQGVTTVDKA